jgi:hypothetical protein
MEYDKNGLIRNEQLQGLVIELDTNGRSFVKSVGTVIMSGSAKLLCQALLNKIVLEQINRS